jgi:DNA-binding transcriptional LysR family regulator
VISGICQGAGRDTGQFKNIDSRASGKQYTSLYRRECQHESLNETITNFSCDGLLLGVDSPLATIFSVTRREARTTAATNLLSPQKGFMYPGIELRLYRYVSVLAEELNFTQAALRLHVSQPTLSTQIRDLERDINIKLFERTRGGQQIALTASGEAFATEARLALLHADRAVHEARAAHGQHTGTWNLGYSPLIDMRIVYKVRGYLSDAHPAADIRFVSGHTAEHIEGLMRGQLQARLVILPAIEDRVTFVVCRMLSRRRCKCRNTILRDDLKSFCLVRRFVNYPRPHMDDSEKALQALAKAGLDISAYFHQG